MATIINADTVVGGAVITADASGVLELQSGGSTKLTINGSGVSLPTAVSVPSGGTGQTSLTANNVILGNGTSAVQFVAPGTNGNVLTSNGTTWTSAAAPAGGSWVYLSTVTATGAPSTVDIENAFNVYDMYVIVGTYISLSASGELDGRLKVGGTYQTSSYATANVYGSSTDATPVTARETTYFSLARGYTSDTNGVSSFVMYIPNPAQAGVYKQVYYQCFASRSTADSNINNGGSAYWGSTNSLTGVRIFSSTGQTIYTGTFRLYGIKNS